MIAPTPVCIDRGREDYQTTFQAMKSFTETRTADSPNQLWFVEHPPVFTQGQAGKPEHLLIQQSDIPVVQSDRGGQITYHGPGQIVCYLLLNLKDYGIGIRTLVTKIEQAVIKVLGELGIQAQNRADAPGVYVEQQKICSIGLRVKKQYTYHGLALNVDMDLSPFDFINPCGYSGLKLTQIVSLLGKKIELTEVQTALKAALIQQLVGGGTHGNIDQETTRQREISSHTNQD